MFKISFFHTIFKIKKGFFYCKILLFCYMFLVKTGQMFYITKLKRNPGNDLTLKGSFRTKRVIFNVMHSLCIRIQTKYTIIHLLDQVIKSIGLFIA
jgi:hypothetical protein